MSALVGILPGSLRCPIESIIVVEITDGLSTEHRRQKRLVALSVLLAVISSESSVSRGDVEHGTIVSFVERTEILDRRHRIIRADA